MGVTVLVFKIRHIIHQGFLEALVVLRRSDRDTQRIISVNYLFRRLFNPL